MIRVLPDKDSQAVKNEMRAMMVDPAGIKIMAPKAVSYLLRVDGVKSFAANILKQESLSAGTDAAITRGALTGTVKQSDCLVWGSDTQLSRIAQKLLHQPFGLDEVGRQIAVSLKNYSKDSFTMRLGRHSVRFGRRTLIMGILNLTPDSFSGDGIYKGRRYRSREDVARALSAAEQMVQDGADMIDVGGQSSRPGSCPVSPQEEIDRTIPVITRLAKKIKVPISIDTYRAAVARRALESGAVIVNDISSARFDRALLSVVKRFKAGLILMHMRGTPRSMQRKPSYKDVMGDIISFLNAAVTRCEGYGIDREQLIVDPGIGFGKTLRHNLQILHSLSELKVLGRPILVGPSRKSFIGTLLDAQPEDRGMGSASACVCASFSGAHLVRVHDVKEAKQALCIADSIRYSDMRQ